MAGHPKLTPRNVSQATHGDVRSRKLSVSYLPGREPPGISFRRRRRTLRISPPRQSARRRRAEAPKARSILLVWLGGGPSHLDLFDPKPNAPRRIPRPVFHDRHPHSRRSIHRAAAEAGGAITQVLADPKQCELSRRTSRGRLDRLDRRQRGHDGLSAEFRLDRRAPARP